MHRCHVIFTAALITLAACPSNRVLAEDSDRAKEVAAYSAIIAELMDHSDFTIGWRVDVFEKELNDEIRTRSAGKPPGEKIFERMKALSDTRVGEAVYGLIRKSAQEQDALRVARLGTAFGGNRDRSATFTGFSWREAMRHMALAMGPSKASSAALREKLCTLGRTEFSLKFAAFKLANFENYIGSAPTKPGDWRLEIDFPVAFKKEPKPACG
jgi:hypothetical protein